MDGEKMTRDRANQRSHFTGAFFDLILLMLFSLLPYLVTEQVPYPKALL